MKSLEEKRVGCYLGELALLAKGEAAKIGQKMTKNVPLVSNWLHFNHNFIYFHTFNIQ